MADDINFSPDMLNNLVNMLKNTSNTNNNDNSPSSSENSIDFESVFSKLSSNFNSSSNFSSNQSSDNDDNSNSNSSNFNLDFETIMKIKSIMETLNDKNDPKSNLLYSLKPYLRKSKQSKLDQYVNLLKLSEVSNLFKGDKK